MITRKLPPSVIDRFGGLSDRSMPVGLTRIESPDLLNIDFSDRTAIRRPGQTRVNTSILRDCCVKLDGYNDYGRITGLTPATRLAIGVECRLNAFPSAEVTLLSRGFGTGASRYLQISYDPTSGNGVWRFRAYDATAATLRNVTVSDGDAAHSQVRVNRHIELITSGAGTASIAVKDGSGNSIGTTSFTWATTVATGTGVADWFIGVDTTDGINVPADGDSSHGPFALAVLRFGDGSVAAEAAACQVVGRELYETTTEYSGLDAYFKLNEGWGAQSSAFSTSHKVTWGRQLPEWVTDSTKVFGTAGLRFNGDNGHVYWDATNFGTHTFTSTATGFKRWLLTFVYVPRLGQGETTVRNQTLLWSGTGSTNPSPIGVRVSADNIVVDYYNGALTSATIALALSTYANTRIRILIQYNDLATDSILCTAQVEGTVTATSTTINPGGTNPTCSSSWTIGRNLSATTYPFTYNTRSAYGIIDDVCLFKDYDPNAGNGPYVPFSFAFREATDQTVFNANGIVSSSVQLVAALRFNEGAGNRLTAIGRQSSTAYLWPEEEDGVLWDTDLADPEVPAAIDRIFDYKAFQSNGQLIRRKLIVLGGAIATMTDAGVVTYVGTIKKRSDGTEAKVTVAQYGSTLFLARENGDRPLRFDGSTCYRAGIHAPLLAPVVTGASSGGALADGTYTVYYTFRNSTTGIESNPSSAGTVVISGGGGAGRIDAIVIQRSGDPQTNQRRIYVTAANGGSGATAYLSATVEDNTTTNYTTDITAVGTTSGVTLEYTENQEAPIGSLVRVFKDQLIVAGHPVYPTRWFYSTAGTPTAFDQTTKYVDADLDQGDPIRALAVISNNLAVMFRDGLRLYSYTGDVSNPYIQSYESLDAGPAGGCALIETALGTFYAGERGAYLFSGSGVQDLSNPDGVDRPSIRWSYENRVYGPNLKNVVACFQSSKGVAMFAVPLTDGPRSLTNESYGNDGAFVFDTTQGVWSRWWIDAEYIAECENTDDLPYVYIGNYGYVYRLNEDARCDGHALQATEAVSSVQSYASSTITSSASSYTSALKGLRAYWNTVGGSTVYVGRITRSTINTITMKLLTPPSAGDALSVGTIPWYADFIFDHGNPQKLKKAKWIKVATILRTAIKVGKLQLSYVLNALQRSVTYTSADQVTLTDTNDVSVGGQYRVFRVRLGEVPPNSGTFVPTTPVPFPNDGPRWDIGHIQFEAEELGAR